MSWGLNPQLLRKWTEAGLLPPDLRAVRRYRLERVRQQLRTRNIDGLVLHDPLNVRYATDTTNMRLLFEPGVTELELWAELQKANFLRHGEWVETRLLASGARTNPWYQEASVKVVEAGELMAFDTDMVGTYGMCVDMSRSWLCGEGRPSAAQADVHSRARDMIVVTESGPELLTEYPLDLA